MNRERRTRKYITVDGTTKQSLNERHFLVEGIIFLFYFDAKIFQIICPGRDRLQVEEQN